VASLHKKDNSAQRVNINLRVRPNAGRNEVTNFTDGILQVKVAAPPVKGKANKELITFLSQKLSISKTAIEIIKGNTSHHKVITINGLTQEEISQKLLP